MNERKQSSTGYPYQFFMASSTDHITGVTGLTPAVLLSKNGGAFAAAAGAITEIGLGWYSLAGNATDRNSLGGCLIHASAAGCDPFDGKIGITPWDPYDSNLALQALPAAAPGSVGGLPTVDANNAVKLPVGTGAGQINLSGGSVAIAQQFPANFACLAISSAGAVTAGTVADKSGYSLAQAFPANFAGLAIDGAGKVGANNLPADYQQRGQAVTLPVGTGAGQVNLSGGSVAIAQQFPANFAGLAISSAGAVTAGTVADKSGYAVAPNGLDAITIEAGVNARQAVTAILASAVGVLAGAATNAITIQGGNVATTRISATVDADGNRTAVSLNLPS